MKLPAIKGFDEAAFSKYLKNTGWLMLARAGSLGIKILSGFTIANFLGKGDLGILNFPLAFTTFFIAIAALGLDGFITRELLRTPEKRDELLGTAFILKLIGGIAILPLIYVAYQLYTSIKVVETPINYIFAAGLIGIAQSFNIIDSYFQSRVAAKWVMVVQIGGNVLSAAIKFLFVYLELSLDWFVASLVFDAFLLAAGYLYFYQKKGASIFKWRYNGTLARFLLKHSWPLAFSAVLVTIYMKIDQLMVEAYLGIDALGIYSTVVQLSESWYFIPVAIVTSVFPAVMNAKRDDPARYQKRLQNMYDLMVWLSLTVAVIISFAAPLIFRLAYTPEFWGGAVVLKVHIWAAIFVFLGSASGQYLIVEGYTKISLWRTAVGALVNILLNIWWIPKYGIIGAAYATLIAYFASTFFMILIPKTRPQAIMMLKSLFLVSVFKKLFRLG